ncbi:hypothetical protein SARC_08361 [Sphaeroforma arctica JP610]|uniref:NTF2-related export protein n=1 Tax=Sphaeroforma arctica JP610 TaxID=667725 RepID=A0A0L0FR01_9EUKA|nr:hypothetical protein SARC_08361 [Sphaeroforma arctica JP610]KNC79237.1 hypothetical protein SARC_08361 [Sphaeroforma arctica JP610]|eukprot:XP_014153139.1 hypothetical protein SARC_08361 [Sphaeroforma arctica JP610]
MDPDIKKKLVLQSCEAGDKFSTTFYSMFDTERHKVGHLYNEDATLIWNGHALSGKKDIQAFLMEKVPSTRTVITDVDCQPAPSVCGDESTLLVTVVGKVKYDTEDVPFPFGETFIMSKQQDGRYLVRSNNFRCMVA